MEYRIVRSKTLEDLEKDVNDAIGDGWVPTGGPMNLPFGFAGYFQALIREESLDSYGPATLVGNLPLLDSSQFVVQLLGDWTDLVTELVYMVTEPD